MGNNALANALGLGNAVAGLGGNAVGTGVGNAAAVGNNALANALGLGNAVATGGGNAQGTGVANANASG